MPIVYFLGQPENSGILNMGGFDCIGHQLKIPIDEGGAFIYCNTKHTEWPLESAVRLMSGIP